MAVVALVGAQGDALGSIQIVHQLNGGIDFRRTVGSADLLVGQRGKMNRIRAKTASQLNTLHGGRSAVLFVMNHASMSTFAPLACVHARTLTIVLLMTLINNQRTRYRGLAKNGAQLTTLFALTNLYMLRRYLLAA